MKDNSLDNWYRGSFEQTPGNPPDFVWDNIAANLDQSAKTSFWSKIVVGSAIVLLLGGATAFFFIADQTSSDWPPIAELPSDYAREVQAPEIANPSGDSNSIPAQNTTVSAPAKSAQNIERQTSDVIETNPAADTPPATLSTATATNIQQQSRAVSNTPQSTATAGNTNFLAEVEPTSTSVQPSTEELSTTPEPMQMQGAPKSLWDYEVYEIPPRNIEPKRKAFTLPDFVNHNSPTGYYVGTGVTLNSVWALNYDTYSGFDKNSMVSNVAQFGSDISLIGGLNVSDTKGYQVELTLFKSRGQSFDSYSEGQQERSRVDLAYSQVNFLFKRKIAKTAFGNKHAASLNFFGGPYVAYLRSSSISQNGVVANTPNRFMNYDAGLDLGLEYDLFFHKKWAATAGIRSSVGLVNIFAGTTKIPRDFNRTYNLSLGANIGLKYLIGK